MCLVSRIVTLRCWSSVEFGAKGGRVSRRITKEVCWGKRKEVGYSGSRFEGTVCRGGEGKPWQAADLLASSRQRDAYWCSAEVSAEQLTSLSFIPCQSKGVGAAAQFSVGFPTSDNLI